MHTFFKNRTEAGRELAKNFTHYLGDSNLVVLALPRGGVPVGYEVAKVLKAPLDVFLVRKLGALDQQELAIGAIASGGVRILNDAIVRYLNISPHYIEEETAKERRDLENGEKNYREGRPPLSLANKVVFLIDDGLATGATMRAAIEAVKAHGPERIIVGVPIAPAEICEEILSSVDELVCPHSPDPFRAVGVWYDDFGQTSDEEVRYLLRKAVEESSEAA